MSTTPQPQVGIIGHGAFHPFSPGVAEGITPRHLREASNIPKPDPIPALAEDIDRIVRQFTGHTGTLPDFTPIIKRHLGL